MSMSTVSLRHHAFTLAFLPVRRVRRFESILRNTHIRVSRRQVKRLLRNIVGLT